MSSNPNNQPPEPDSRGALRRMLLVLAIALGMAIYAYGWTVTEIDLTLPQEARRQETLTRALRELLSPRIFDQERELTRFEAPFLLDCSTGDAPEQASLNSLDPAIVVEPACAESDDVITVRVANVSGNADARLRWIPPVEEGEDPTERPLEILETGREEFVLDASGGFTGTIEVPRIRGTQGQIHRVRLLVAVPTGPITFSETANQVIDRMVQTIFMALVATTVAIPIAAFLSFFAARNLMRRVRLSVGSMLLAFIAFAVGIWIGAAILNIIAEWGLTVGRGALIDSGGWILAFVIPVALVAATIFLLGRVRIDETAPNRTLQIINTIIRTLVLIFIIGALGGLAIMLGTEITTFADSLRPDDTSGLGGWIGNAIAELIWSVGNILFILGTLIDLFSAGFSAIVTGFAFSGIVVTLLAIPLRSITGLPSRLLAAIMGAISGAILMGVISLLGLWAALLGLLLPVVGGILGGQVALQIFKRVRFGDRIFLPGARISRADVTLRQAAFAIGFVVIFLLIFNRLNIGRSLIDGTLPSQNRAVVLDTELPIAAYVFEAMIFGAVLAGISGFFSGLQAIFPLGNVFYNVSRTTLNIVRSIEPLIMGLVFVIWVGIGPFAGVLALTLHSIAALGKLYSEQIENIDPGPIEALQSTGANQLQTIVYAVVPQIIPPYIAFTIYRWDINVRLSTIIGFVGGGGIGLLLQQQINLLRYRDAGVAVLAIAVVVSILDYASAVIRERVT